MIYPSAGFYNKDTLVPYLGYFGLYFECGYSAEADANERKCVIDKLIDFSKNHCNIIIKANINGHRENCPTGGAWKAQKCLCYPVEPTNPTMVASLGHYKAAIKADHAIPDGILFKLTADTPPRWSPTFPFNLS